ncbi:hypothetical protein NQ314_003245 [Rhamnusium bicolor]|uniref:Uncharacterized protein n=1 Tax=Rhamnusium bicolor TaxID=1586634 RepID=A0AAV8ZND5_9CUCU|nr:hypothetical protein NQ314_003245 [Rhamnusium bicolor]
MSEFSVSQKEYLDKLFMKLNASINQKLTEVTNQINEIKDEISEVANKHDEEIEELKEENQQLRKENKFLQRKVRKNNIVIYGINVNDNLSDTVINTLNNLLEISISEQDINDIYRIGKINNKQPLLVELISYQKKRLILNNAKKLKGKNIFIAEDQCWEDRNITKTLVTNLKIAKAKGKNAQIKGNKLIIENQAYTAEELQNNCLETEIEEEEEEQDGNTHNIPIGENPSNGGTTENGRGQHQRKHQKADDTKALSKAKNDSTQKKYLRSNAATTFSKK